MVFLTFLELLLIHLLSFHPQRTPPISKDKGFELDLSVGKILWGLWCFFTTELSIFSQTQLFTFLSSFSCLSADWLGGFTTLIFSHICLVFPSYFVLNFLRIRGPERSYFEIWLKYELLWVGPSSPISVIFPSYFTSNFAAVGTGASLKLWVNSSFICMPQTNTSPNIHHSARSKTSHHHDHSKELGVSSWKLGMTKSPSSVGVVKKTVFGLSPLLSMPQAAENLAFDRTHYFEWILRGGASRCDFIFHSYFAICLRSFEKNMKEIWRKYGRCETPYCLIPTVNTNWTLNSWM